MDIQVSSNVERLLFELYDRNATLLVDRMTEFRAEGSVDTGDTRLATVTEVFDGASFDDDAVRDEIRRTHDATGVVLDPHTAVGVAAARARRRDPDVPMVALATAHPAKFPDAVEDALGIRPELPEHLADLLDRPERFTTLPYDLAALKAHVLAVTGR
jgi:threonine synthase